MVVGLVVALLLDELVELEQGEGLFDVGSGLGLVHRSPFLPTVGPAVLCWHADPPGQHLGDGVDAGRSRPHSDDQAPHLPHRRTDIQFSERSVLGLAFKKYCMAPDSM